VAFREEFESLDNSAREVFSVIGACNGLGTGLGGDIFEEGGWKGDFTGVDNLGDD